VTNEADGTDATGPPEECTAGTTGVHRLTG
jgi:hypothetical protein